MFLKEAEIVDAAFVMDTNTYNIKQGGDGGFDYINNNGRNLYGKNGQPSYGGENLLDGKKLKSYLQSIGKWDLFRQQVSAGVRDGYQAGNIVNGFKGKTHTTETKRLIGDTNSVKQLGDRNSQYGTCWMHDPTTLLSKKVKNVEVQHWQSLGFIKGRKMAPSRGTAPRLLS